MSIPNLWEEIFAENRYLTEIVPTVPLTAKWIPCPDRVKFDPWNRVWIDKWGILEKVDPVPFFYDVAPVQAADLRFVSQRMTVTPDMVMSFNLWAEWVSRPFGIQTRDGMFRALVATDVDWVEKARVMQSVGFTVSNWIRVEKTGNWSLEAEDGDFQIFRRVP